MTINSFRDLLDLAEAEAARQTLELSASLNRQILALRNAIARKVEEGR